MDGRGTGDGGHDRRRRGHRRTFTETYRAEQLAFGLASLQLEHKRELQRPEVIDSPKAEAAEGQGGALLPRIDSEASVLRSPPPPGEEEAASAGSAVSAAPSPMLTVVVLSPYIFIYIYRYYIYIYTSPMLMV